MGALFPLTSLQADMAASSVFKAGLFNHKVAIVTGGGTGIGKAITSELLQLGMKLKLKCFFLCRFSSCLQSRTVFSVLTVNFSLDIEQHKLITDNVTILICLSILFLSICLLFYLI